MEEENKSENYYEREYNEKYDTYDYVNDAKNIDPKYEPSTAAKVLLVLMAIFLNFIGAILGIVIGGIYMNKNQQGYKSYGKMLLIISIVFLILDILFLVFLFAAVGTYMSMFIMCLHNSVQTLFA